MSYFQYKTLKCLKKLAKQIRDLRFLIVRPSKVSIFLEKEDDMAIKFAVVLPEPPVVESDWVEVSRGELTVTIGDNEPIVVETDKSVQEGEVRHVVDDRFVGPQDTVVQLEFLYVDDAGNRSAPVTVVQALLDTVPPVVPTSVGLVEVEEIPDVVV